MTTAMWGGVAAAVAWGACGAGPHPSEPGFEMVQVADGVVALVRSKAPGFMLDANAVVPGHGPVLRGDGEARLYRDFLAAVAAQTREAQASGEGEAEALRGLDVGAFRARMTGGSPVLERLFDAWGPAPAVGAHYRVRQGGER
jgi:hypothetical protein